MRGKQEQLITQCEYFFNQYVHMSEAEESQTEGMYLPHPLTYLKKFLFHGEYLGGHSITTADAPNLLETMNSYTKVSKVT